MAQALRSLLDQLQEEQRLLAPLCKSGRIKELRSLGVEIPTDSRLVEMMATSELKKDLFNAWTDAGLDVRDLARGGLGDLALEDLDSAVPGGLSLPGAVAGARHVLAARMSFPHMDKARFLALAPLLLERQVPLDLLQCMADWAIEPNPDKRAFKRDLLMDSGLPGALAFEEHLMRKAIGRSTPDAPYQGTALFDPKSLLEGMNLA